MLLTGSDPGADAVHCLTTNKLISMDLVCVSVAVNSCDVKAWDTGSAEHAALLTYSAGLRKTATRTNCNSHTTHTDTAAATKVSRLA